MQISVPLDNDLLDDIINQRHVDNDVNNLFYIFLTQDCSNFITSILPPSLVQLLIVH